MFMRLKKWCAKVFHLSDFEIVDLNYDVLFKPMIFCLKILACVPTLQKEPYWIIHISLRIGIYLLIVWIILNSIIYHDRHGDIRNLIANVSYIVIVGVIASKKYTLLSNRKKFYDLMNFVKADYAKVYQLEREDQLILLHYAKRAKLVVFLWIAAVFLYGIASLLMPLVLMIYYFVIGESKFVPTMLMTLPPIFDVMNDASKNCFTTVASNYISLYTMSTFVAVVSQGLIYMLHACGRIDMLKKKVLLLFPEDSHVVPINMHHRMKLICKELQNIYDFVDDINITSSFVYEATLKVSSVIIPMSALLIIEELKHGTISLQFVILLAATMLFSSLPCYHGNLLMVKSMELHEAVYFCGWQRVWEKSTRTSLLIMMTRMQRAIAISSVFGVMNLETLADVFRTSYRMFSILSAAWTIEY